MPCLLSLPEFRMQTLRNKLSLGYWWNVGNLSKKHMALYFITVRNVSVSFPHLTDLRLTVIDLHGLNVWPVHQYTWAYYIKPIWRIHYQNQT